MRIEERVKLLADHFGIDEKDIIVDDILENQFSLPNGNTYLVVDSEEAYQAAKDDIIDFIDDLGIGGFTPWFQDWIYDNACDKDWFAEAQRELAESYAQDIKYEDDYDGECVNRLVAELKENGILSQYDGELVENSDGLLEPIEDVDMDEKVDEFVDLLCDRWGDPYEWYKDEFGEEGLKNAQDNLSLDYDAIVDKAIEEDGVAHFIARYDGKEIELGKNEYGDDVFAYRV